MKKILSALLCVFLFTGCIHISEEIFLEKNGSGRYVMTMDLEKMMEMVEMARAFAPDSALKKAGDLDATVMDSLQNAMGDLSSVPGITEFRKQRKDKNSFEISFRFRDVAALNAAMRKRNQRDPGTQDLYAFSKGHFAYIDSSNFGLNDALRSLDGLAQDSLQAGMEMIRSMMGDMSYTTIYHMPGRVKEFTNKEATLDADGNTVRLRINMLDRSGTSSLMNGITYKK